MANGSSHAAVNIDCTPPRTEASASYATRTTLLCAWGAYNDAPPATQPTRNMHDRSSSAPYRSRTMWAQRRRPARYFAISSKKSPCV